MAKRRIIRPVVKVIPRKNKADPRTVNLILKAIEEGLTQKDAAILAGVDQDTITNWKKYSDFSDQMRVAEIKNKRKHVLNIEKAAKDDPRHSKWFLERRYRDEYGITTTKDTETLHEPDVLQEILKKVSAILDGPQFKTSGS